MLDSNEFAPLRAEMIERQLCRRGFKDQAVISAMLAVPRHRFVPVELQAQAYEDVPLPIGSGQTISQPYIVAAMTAALHLKPSDRVLEIGTGCGYQAAILSKLAQEVVTIESRPELASAASERLAQLGFSNIHVHCGDGTLGLPEFAPFDAILVAAAAPSIPHPLLAQLAEGGRMIIPVGDSDNQELQLVEKHDGAIAKKTLDGCRFVPLIGRHGWQTTP